MNNTQPSSTHFGGSTHNGRIAAGQSINQPTSDGRQFAAEVALIEKYLAFVRRCAATLAHGPNGEDDFVVTEGYDLFVALEEAILTRVADGPAIVDSLEGWQAGLIHLDRQTPASDCLVCRRGKQVPDVLPPDYAWALRVVGEAA